MRPTRRLFLSTRLSIGQRPVVRFDSAPIFAANHEALFQIRQRLKLFPCPHCGLVGGLIGHGFLRGYAEIGSSARTRGRRIFCSNRFRRAGCGRTFSVLLAELLRCSSLSTSTLFAFVTRVLRGHARKTAWTRVRPARMSHQSGYQLWKRLQRAQPRLRTLLSERAPPPPDSSDAPLAQLIAHMRQLLVPGSPLFRSFQLHFQTPLLGD